jgi:signal transduction histidine kinase
MANESASVWIWRQLMRIAIIVIGLLPILSSRLIQTENRFIVFLLAGGILIVGALGEVWKPRFAKKKKDVANIIQIQIILHFFLLTLFLQLFGRINGPLFLLYLPVIMEAFLSKNIFLGNTITLAIIFITVFDYGWLFIQGQVGGLFSYIEFIVRILSLAFIRAYGMLMAREIIAEEKSREELQKTADQLNKINLSLKRMAKLKDEFISVASHQLRSPSSTVKGYLAMVLEGDAGRVPAKIRSYLEDAYASNDRMIRLVNNMLSVSQVESGRLVGSPKNAQIEEVIDQVVREFLWVAKKQKLKLKHIPSKEKLPKVWVDADQVREVLTNLVGNALNFTTKGQIIIKSYLKSKSKTVVVEVADTGTGISRKDRPHIFKKFAHIREDHGRPKRGSGLGLYICKTLLQGMGGKIWLKSRVGHGTTFYFSLPVSKQRK